MEFKNTDHLDNKSDGQIADFTIPDKNGIGEKIPLADLNEPSTVDTTVVIEDTAKKQLIYSVSESPPIHVTIICGLQVRRIVNYHAEILKYM